MTLNTSMLNKVSAKQISENFAKSYPDLLEGAVITKIEISGCQGSRRTDKIDCLMMEMILRIKKAYLKAKYVGLT
ncbi:hypothetical protein [Enterobacter hormaechei]|uniref:hypothetical protein n=1 Tax=Enterobacter hormaechei TaxID=158836 RepID=UPI001F15C358|nr:hypothetical protein [Enterobacter hormaechei]